VICPDHCGFADVVTTECGIKIPVHNCRKIEVYMAAAIKRLDSDEQERQRLARGALERIKDFSWEKKAVAVNSIYEKVVANGSGKNT